VGFWPKKVGICPVLKTKVATKNPVFMRVCGLLVNFPLLFLINCEKKLKIIINKKNFWPFDQIDI